MDISLGPGVLGSFDLGSGCQEFQDVRLDVESVLPPSQEPCASEVVRGGFLEAEANAGT